MVKLEKELKALGGDVNYGRGSMLHLILTLCRKLEEAFNKIVDGKKDGGEGDTGAVSLAPPPSSLASHKTLLGHLFPSLPSLHTHLLNLFLSLSGCSPHHSPPFFFSLFLCAPAGERILEVFEVKLKEAIQKLPFQKILTLRNVQQVVNEADGYQPHIIAPENGYRR